MDNLYWCPLKVYKTNIVVTIKCRITNKRVNFNFVKESSKGGYTGFKDALSKSYFCYCGVSNWDLTLTFGFKPEVP